MPCAQVDFVDPTLLFKDLGAWGNAISLRASSPIIVEKMEDRTRHKTSKADYSSQFELRFVDDQPCLGSLKCFSYQISH